MRDLDMRHVHLGETGIRTFQRKVDARTFAKANGWRSSDVISACNRFMKFWIVGQCVGVERFAALDRSGHVVEFQFRGFV
jgi:hypothetical protein